MLSQLNIGTLQDTEQLATSCHHLTLAHYRTLNS